MSDARQRVLDVAETLFMRAGYSAVTLRDIADQLGIQQASLYYHFPDGKEQIYVEVAERAFARHRAGMDEAIKVADTNLDARIRAVMRWFESQPTMNLSSIMHADMPALGHDNEKYLSRVAYESLFEPLCRLFAESQAKGETRSMNPNVLAGTILAIVDGMAFSGRRPGTPPRAEMVDDVIAILLDGVRTKNQEIATKGPQ